jgi:predicted phage terminase large subunit-like protein
MYAISRQKEDIKIGKKRKKKKRKAVKEDVAFTEDSLVKSIVMESFYDFVREFWDTIVPEKPVWNWHIKYLCDEIQEDVERVFRGEPRLNDIIINVAPGSTKSIIASIMLPAWTWTRFPSCRCICGSYAANLALELSRKGRDVIKSDKYRRIFPEIELRDDQDTKSNFANTKGGQRYAVGVGGSVTGMHGHILIIDDPLDPTKAISEVELKTANTWMAETLSTRKVDKEVTLTILIMQRLHQDDCTANMITRAKKRAKLDNEPIAIKHICLPAELTNKVKPARMKDKYVNGLMDPVRVSRKVLNDQQTTLGEYGYAGQFLQWPVPAGGGMFKTGRILIDVPPDKKSKPRFFKQIVRAWDKAGTHDGGAYTVGCKMAKDEKGVFWILHVERFQRESAEREERIKEKAISDTRKVEVVIEQEPGSGGKESAENTVRNLAGWKVVIDKPSGSESSKILRADPFSVQVNNGNVRMVPAEWNEEFIDELKFFPYSKYKDQVDAASAAFNRLARGRTKVGAFFTDG